MIKFTEQDNNKQFISIEVKDNTPTETIKENLKNTYAYGYEEGTDYSKSESLHFQTAWSAPHPVIQKLAQMYPEISFEHEWADEDIGANCGRKCYSGGECTEEYYPESEIEAIEFAFRVWDYDPLDYDLMLNKTETAYINIENEKLGSCQHCSAGKR